MRIRIRRFWRRRRDEEDDSLLPPSRTPRLLVAAAALAVTAVIAVALLTPHLDFLRARHDAAQPKPCAPGQTRDCIGGTMGVIVAPAASGSAN